MYRVERELEAVGDAELIENIVQVIFYGLLADEELFTNFFVAEALSDMLDYFLFAVGEERLFAALSRFRRLGECLINSAVMRLSSQISPE